MTKKIDRRTPMELRETGVTCKVILPKPYTFWSPEVHSIVNGEDSYTEGPTLYCKTGTIITFDRGFWMMEHSFVDANLNESVTIHYDMPGNKLHSRHNIGEFVTSVHRISNLIYHAKEESQYRY